VTGGEGLTLHVIRSSKGRGVSADGLAKATAIPARNRSKSEIATHVVKTCEVVGIQLLTLVLRCVGA
jgi:hypothetical protein